MQVPVFKGLVLAHDGTTAFLARNYDALVLPHVELWQLTFFLSHFGRLSTGVSSTTPLVHGERLLEVLTLNLGTLRVIDLPDLLMLVIEHLLSVD